MDLEAFKRASFATCLHCGGPVPAKYDNPFCCKSHRDARQKDHQKLRGIYWGESVEYRAICRKIARRLWPEGDYPDDISKYMSRTSSRKRRRAKEGIVAAFAKGVEEVILASKLEERRRMAARQRECEEWQAMLRAGAPPATEAPSSCPAADAEGPPGQPLSPDGGAAAP